MQKLTIGFIGRPVSGKTTSLNKLAEIYKLGTVNDIFLDEQHMKQIKHLYFTVENSEIDIYVLPGPIFYMEELYRYIISRADAIFYFFNLEMDYKYDNDVEQQCFEKHMIVAEGLNKLWVDIPWVFVINKKMYLKSPDFTKVQFDLRIPKHLLDSAIYTDTYKGKGIDLIWGKVMEIVKSNGQLLL